MDRPNQARPTALEASTLNITPPMRVRYSWSSIWIRTRTYYFHVSFFFRVLIYLSCNFACLGYRIKFHHFILSITKLIIMLKKRYFETDSIRILISYMAFRASRKCISLSILSTNRLSFIISLSLFNKEIFLLRIILRMYNYTVISSE